MKVSATIRIAQRAGIAAVGVSAALAVRTGTAGAATTSLPTGQLERTIVLPLVQRASIIVGGLPSGDLVSLNPQPIPPGIIDHPPVPIFMLFPPSSGTK